MSGIANFRIMQCVRSLLYNTTKSIRRLNSTDVSSRPTPPNEPIKFSQSEAYSRSQHMRQRSEPSKEALQQRYMADKEEKIIDLCNSLSAVCSIAIFMVYFLILRKENDLDLELSKPLWQRLPSLEEKVLNEKIILGKNKGEDVTQFEVRYNELSRLRKEHTAQM